MGSPLDVGRHVISAAGDRSVDPANSADSPGVVSHPAAAGSMPNWPPVLPFVCV